MIISCPELVKIKRGNKIKEVHSGVVGTAGGTMAVRSERYDVCSGMAMRAAVG